MVADRKLLEAELFQVVGAGWKQHESEKRKKTFREKLKGKPVFSAFLLFLIFRPIVSMSTGTTPFSVTIALLVL